MSRIVCFSPCDLVVSWRLVWTSSPAWAPSTSGRGRSAQTRRQSCGSVFIWYGSGSSILSWIPIRIQGFWWPKIEKNLQLKKKFNFFFCQKLKKIYSWKKNLTFFFWAKTTIYLSLGLHKGGPRYKRILQNIQHFKTWNFFSSVGHLCPPGSKYGSGFRIRIRIHWPDWIRIRNPGRRCSWWSRPGPHVLVTSRSSYARIIPTRSRRLLPHPSKAEQLFTILYFILFFTNPFFRPHQKMLSLVLLN